ncbi:MAG TPA: hypothetical protein VFB22_04930 [Candidatus Baltobacteraceae bacterium]|nr:hypothetical protein [Candidatus Baltobacteraceae bacterium]
MQRYYALWNDARYADMYAMLSRRFQSSHPYQQYADAHANVPHIDVTATPGERPDEVAVAIVSTDREPDGHFSRNRLQATWRLVVEHGSARLDDESVTSLGANASEDRRANGDVRDIVVATRELTVIADRSGQCTGMGVVYIRFNGDGTTGCVDLMAATRGTSTDGDPLLIVPVSAPNRGVVYALLYAGEDARFIGILPGDGTGHLDVELQDGVIVERNGAHVKRSLYRSGHVFSLQ